MQGGYFWKGVGLKRRGESDGEEGGGRQWFTTAASQRGWWKWCFAAGDSGARGVYSHRCVISQGLRVHPHHTICNEEVPRQPQDCSEWVRRVTGETYPVRKANGCRPKKKEGIVLYPWQQSSLKWNTKRSDYSRLKMQQIKSCKQNADVRMMTSTTAATLNYKFTNK